MNIEYRTGNLFQQKDLIAWGHGVNCAGAMGRGIAVAFREYFPEMFKEYASRCRLGALKPGDVFAWEPLPSEQVNIHYARSLKVVYNLATQPDWNHTATLAYIKASIERMVVLAAKDGISHVGIPRIGAGLGGLTWEAVEATLKAAHGPGVTLVVVSPAGA